MSRIWTPDKRLLQPNNGQWTNGGGSLSLANKSLAVAHQAGGSGNFFTADFTLTSQAAFEAQFNDINAYAGSNPSYPATVSYVNGFNHTGTGAGKRSYKITYWGDDSGVEIKYGPFTQTTSLYCRTREFFAPAGYPSGIATTGNVGWNGNMPAGLKTCRFFTTSDFVTDGSVDGGAGWAYQSEKLLYAPNYQDPYGNTWDESRGFGSGNYLYDRNGYYVTPWQDPDYYGSGAFTGKTPINFSSGGTLPWIREGEWYLIERWLVLNSSASANGGYGSNDGIWIVKINGVTVVNFTDMPFVANYRNDGGQVAGPASGLGGWRSMWFGGNYSQGNSYFAYPGDGIPMDRYISEMVLSTTQDWV